ncbi:MAG TPA: hypothetical protein VGJ15_02130 [Pirellulales bacterium]|jgi:hypothetical protein
MNRSPLKLNATQNVTVLRIALVSVALASIANIAFAGGPLDFFAPVKKVDADPNNDYPLGKSNGPWLIMAKTFQGDSAAADARKLVYELRSKYHMVAYTHDRTLDLTKTERGIGMNPDGTPKSMHYLQGGVIKEVAVLVGDFEMVDDAVGQKTLKQLKTLEPDLLKAEVQEVTNPDGSKTKIYPMRHALMVTNPLLPKEFFVAKGVDKLVLDMNKGVANCLLDCPGKYSVRVASFSGSTLIDQRKIREVEDGNKSLHSRLADAAEKAHNLTVELRKKGWEAYEFHDRGASMVCVGSFDSVGVPRADGKTEINPTIFKIMQTFGADQSGLSTGVALKPKHVAGIPLDVQATPVEVPRRSISADYQQSMRTAL